MTHRLIHSHWPLHWPPHWHANEAIDLLSDIFTSLHVAVLKSLKRFFYCQWELEESLHRHLVKAKLKSCSVQTITLTANHGETPKFSLIGSCICSRVQAQTFRLLSGGGQLNIKILHTHNSKWESQNVTFLFVFLLTTGLNHVCEQSLCFSAPGFILTANFNLVFWLNYNSQLSQRNILILGSGLLDSFCLERDALIGSRTHLFS